MPKGKNYEANRFRLRAAGMPDLEQMTRFNTKPAVCKVVGLGVDITAMGVSKVEEQMLCGMINRFAEKTFQRLIQSRKEPGDNENEVVSDLLYASVQFRLPAAVRQCVTLTITTNDKGSRVRVVHRSGFEAEEPIEIFPTKMLCDQLLVLA